MPSRTALGTKTTVSTNAHTLTDKIGVVKNSGLNPIQQEDLYLAFECIGNMLDLVFVKFAIRHEGQYSIEPLVIYYSSLGSFQMGQFCSPNQ